MRVRIGIAPLPSYQDEGTSTRRPLIRPGAFAGTPSPLWGEGVQRPNAPLIFFTYRRDTQHTVPPSRVILMVPARVRSNAATRSRFTISELDTRTNFVPASYSSSSYSRWRTVYTPWAVWQNTPLSSA